MHRHFLSLPGLIITHIVLRRVISTVGSVRTWPFGVRRLSRRFESGSKLPHSIRRIPLPFSAVQARKLAPALLPREMWVMISFQGEDEGEGNRLFVRGTCGW